MTYEQVARQILEEAAAVDEEEDHRYGERRGDELPEGLRSWRERRDWLRKARRELEAEQAERPQPGNSRAERLAEAERRLAEQHALERRAVEAEQAAQAKRLAEHRERGHKPARRRRRMVMTVDALPVGRKQERQADVTPLPVSAAVSSLGAVFDHVGIAAADLAASERFYRTVLSALGAEPTHADAELVEWEDWAIGPTDREHAVTPACTSASARRPASPWTPSGRRRARAIA